MPIKLSRFFQLSRSYELCLILKIEKFNCAETDKTYKKSGLENAFIQVVLA